jgi:hypothetical protein
MPYVTPLRAADPRRVGRYRLAGRIAGMPVAGLVYLASTVDGNEVTVTLLGDDEIGDSAARHRFAQEASTARRVAPFCVTRILDSGLDGGQAYLVSEYVTGSSLEEIVAAGGARAGRELGALALGAATGLAAIHQAGLVHGGFGPGNLILSPAGPRVVEFGITPPYGAATPAADMLAWGQTVVFAAAGSPDAGLRELGVLPANLGRLAAACLSTNPAARPAARLVVAALLGEESPSAGLLAEASRRAAVAGPASASASPPVSPPAPASPVPAAPHVPAAAPDSGPALIPAAAAVAALAPDPPAPDRVPEPDRVPAPAMASALSTPPPSSGAAWSPLSAPEPEVTGPRPPLEDQPASEQNDRPPARRRRAVMLWAAVAAVAVLGVVALLHSTLRPGAAGSAGGTASSPAGSAAPSPTPSPPAAPAVPPALAGSWSGQARQVDPTDVFNVRLDLLTGGRVSTISYSGTTFSCSGDLSPVSSAAGTLTMSQGIVTGETSCANGVVTLRQAGPASLEFTFQGQAGPAARGTLAKG